MSSDLFELSGAIDMQVHSGPDTRPRVVSDAELAEACERANFAGAVLKGHRDPTTSRALSVNAIEPSVTLFGSVVLNRNVGGFNPYAVEAMVGLSGKVGRVVWLPTLDADNDTQRTQGGSLGLRAIDAGGHLDAGLEDVLQIVAADDLVLGSGHIAPDETTAVFERARSLGCKRLIATHVTSPITLFEESQMDRIVELGGFLEICAWSTIKHRDDERAAKLAIDSAVRLIGKFGANQVVISSDLGKPGYPEPTDGLRTFAQMLLNAGVTAADIVTMCVRNPTEILT